MNGAGQGQRPARPVRLAPGAEFDLIRRFFEVDGGTALGAGAGSDEARGVRVGAGDDCAVVVGDGIAVGTDLSVEGVHFQREWLRPDEIGYRAAMVALSDLAAIAARPIGVLASLMLPERDVPDTAIAVMAGVREAAAAVGAVVLGGDVARSPGPLAIDVVVLGETSEPILRGGAKAGDELWVTGELGAAAAAVRQWQRGDALSSRARERFARPAARVREAGWLAAQGLLRALIDLSDGLAGDAAQLAAASGLAAVIERDAVPVDGAAAEAMDHAEAALGLALGGGEDYELCFAAEPGTVDPVAAEFKVRFGISLHRVGRFEPGSGVYVEGPDGGRERPGSTGYRHFEKGAR